MAKLYDGSKGADNDSTTWYLKINEDTVYGPISMAALCEWAEQGRVSADSLVSSDSKNWITSEHLPELKMDWVAELKNGSRFGPFNLKSVPILIQRGIININSVLLNINTAKQISVDSFIRRDPADKPRQPIPMPAKPAVEQKAAPQQKQAEPAAAPEQKMTKPPAPAQIPPPPQKAALEKQDTPIPAPVTEQKAAPVAPAPSVPNKETEALKAELEKVKKDYLFLRESYTLRETELQNMLIELQHKHDNTSMLLSEASKKSGAISEASSHSTKQYEIRIRELGELASNLTDDCRSKDVAIDELKRQLTDIRAKQVEIEEEKIIKHKELEKAAAHQKELEASIAKLSVQEGVLSEKVWGLESDIGKARQQIDTLQSEKQAALKQSESAAKELEKKYSEEISRRERDFRDISHRFELLQKELTESVELDKTVASLKQHVRKLETELAKSKTDETFLQEKADQAKAALSELRKELDSAAEEAVRLRAGQKSSHDDAESLRKKLDETTAAIETKYREEISRRDSELNDLTRKLEMLGKTSSEASELSKTTAALKQHIQKLESELAKSKTDKARYQTTAEETKAALSALRKDLDSAAEEAARLRAEQKRSHDEAESLRKKFEDSTAAIEMKYREEISRRDNELNDLTRKLEMLGKTSSEASELSKTTAALKQHIQKLESELAKSKKDEALLQTKSAETMGALSALKRELDSATEEANRLRAENRKEQDSAEASRKELSAAILALKKQEKDSAAAIEEITESYDMHKAESAAAIRDMKNREAGLLGKLSELEETCRNNVNLIADLNETRKQRDDAGKQLEKLKDDLSRERSAVKFLNQELYSQKTKAEAIADELTATIASAAKEAENSSRRIQDYSSEIDSLMLKLESAQVDSAAREAGLKSAIASLELKLSESDMKRASAEQELDTERSRNTKHLEQWNTRKTQLELSIESLKESVAGLRLELDTARRDAARLKQESAGRDKAHKARIDEMESLIAGLTANFEKERSRANDTRSALNTEKEQRAAEQKSFEEREKVLLAKIRSIEKEENVIENKLDHTAKELQEEKKGFNLFKLIQGDKVTHLESRISELNSVLKRKDDLISGSKANVERAIKEIDSLNDKMLTITERSRSNEAALQARILQLEKENSSLNVKTEDIQVRLTEALKNSEKASGMSEQEAASLHEALEKALSDGTLLKNSMDAAQAESEKAAAVIDAKNSELSSAARKNSELESEIVRLRIENGSISAESQLMKKLEADAKILQEELIQARAEIEKLSFRNSQFENQVLESQQKAEEAIRQASGGLQGANADTTLILNELTRERELRIQTQKMADQIHIQLLERLKNLERASTASAGEMEQLRHQLADSTAAREEIERESHRLKSNVDSIKAELTRTDEERKRVNDELEAARRELQAVEEQRRHEPAAIPGSTVDSSAVSAQIDELKKKIRELTEKNIMLAKAMAVREEKLNARIQDLQDDSDKSTQLLEAAQKELNSRKGPSAAAKPAEEPSADAAALLDAYEKEKAARNTLANSFYAREQALFSKVSDLEKQLASGTVPQQQVMQYENEVKDLRKKLDESIKETTRLNIQIKDRDIQISRLSETASAVKAAPASPVLETQELKPVIQEPKTEQWHLKLDDGSIFGPVSTADISKWAEDCRIGPDHDVSSDKKTWIKAKDIPALMMEWNLDLIDGTPYGPMNLIAVKQLIADGSADANAVLTHKVTGEKCQASKILIPQVEQLIRARTDLMIRIDASEKNLRGCVSRITDLETQITRLSSDNKRLIDETKLPPRFAAMHILGKKG